MESLKMEFMDVKSVYEEITNYGHPEYNEMKEEMGWHNVDVAKIVGYKHMSVKNQTRKSNPLPIWAQLLVFVWRMKYKGAEYLPKDEELEKFQALVVIYKEKIEKFEAEISQLKKENEAAAVSLRKEERRDKKLRALLKKLEGIEAESEAEIPESATGEVKRLLNSLNSKHRRKGKVLASLRELVPEEIPTNTKRTPNKGKKTNTVKGSTKGVKVGTTKGNIKASTKRGVTPTRKSKETAK